MLHAPIPSQVFDWLIHHIKSQPSGKGSSSIGDSGSGAAATNGDTVTASSAAPDGGAAGGGLAGGSAKLEVGNCLQLLVASSYLQVSCHSVPGEVPSGFRAWGGALRVHRCNNPTPNLSE